MRTHSDEEMEPLGLHDNTMGLIHGTTTLFHTISERIARGELVGGDVIDLVKAFPHAPREVQQSIARLFHDYRGVAYVKKWWQKKERRVVWSLTRKSDDADSLVVSIKKSPRGWDKPVSRLVSRDGVWFTPPIDLPTDYPRITPRFIRQVKRGTLEYERARLKREALRIAENLAWIVAVIPGAKPTPTKVRVNADLPSTWTLFGRQIKRQLRRFNTYGDLEVVVREHVPSTVEFRPRLRPSQH